MCLDFAVQWIPLEQGEEEEGHGLVEEVEEEVVVVEEEEEEEGEVRRQSVSCLSLFDLFSSLTYSLNFFCRLSMCLPSIYCQSNIIFYSPYQFCCLAVPIYLA